MKKIIPLSLWWLTSITLALLILQGCERNGIEKDIDITSDTGYEGFQSDVELFYEFAYLKEAMILEFLNYTSDGFTKGPLEGTLSMEECRRLVVYVADINEKAEQYEAAAQRLEQSGVLLSPTSTRGLFGSITNFFTKVSGIQKRNRQRYMVVYTNVGKGVRTKMYESALKCWDSYGWYDKPHNEQDFYNRMIDGSYDKHGNRLLGDLMTMDDADVLSTLQEKGLTLQDLTRDYGEITASGAQIALDGFSTVVPGSGIGMEAAKVSDNVDRLVNAKDFKEKAQAKEDMKKYIKEKIFGETTVEVTDFVCEQLAEHMERVSQEASREVDNKAQGKIVVKDKNVEQPAKIVISQKKESAPSDDGPSIYVTGKKWVKEGIDQILATGKWLVTAINEQGRRETVEIEVKPGKVTVTEVNTEEPEDPPGEDVIVLTLDKLDGKSEIAFFVDFLPGKREKIWIDLNGNNRKDKGEEIQDFSVLLSDYLLDGIPTVKTVKIHGASFITYLNNSTDYYNITSIDVRKCKALKRLDIYEQPLTSSILLDGCMALERFECSYTEVTSLDITGCPALKEFWCLDNKLLTKLNISECPALKEINCGTNKMTSLDVSGLTSLEKLKYEPYNPSELNASGCTALKELKCNYITNLNISGCTALKELTHCFGSLTDFNISGCTALERLDCSDRKISNLNAFGCTALKELNCSHNELISLNVFDCTALKKLDCSHNKLTNLNASGCTALETLYCNHNLLFSLNVSGFTTLKRLECRNNQLTSLNTSGCTALESIWCSDNQLSKLNVTDCTALKSLTCENNGLLGVITPFIRNFLSRHDERYKYKYDWEQRKYVMIEDTKRGWWYEHEPGGGCHKPEPCNK